MNTGLRDPTARTRWGVCVLFFFSGATSLIFEVLWSLQFVTVFGNSSYSISVVLCAYMTGLGLGGFVGGKFADRITRHVAMFSAVQAAIAFWAFVVPVLLEWLRELAPKLSILSPESLLVSTVARFAFSFCILAVPCFLMGTTLPLLSRAVTNSEQQVGRRVGVLYSLNTLGAACGCLAAGFWMLQALGLRLTNLLALAVNLLVAVAALALSRSLTPSRQPVPPAIPESELNGRQLNKKDYRGVRMEQYLLLSVAFINGLVSLACEVLWFRYLAFLKLDAYVFPTILCIYLLGLGLGALVYGVLAGRLRFPMRALGIIEFGLATSILATFAVTALIFASGPPRTLGLPAMAFCTVFPPVVLMGVAFPLLCSLYAKQVQTLGARIGLLVTFNTAGTVLGSLLPTFVLVPLLGIQKSLVLISILCGGIATVVLILNSKKDRSLIPRGAALGYGLGLLVFLMAVPWNLCQRVFLATDCKLARHTELLAYVEGRTGTAILARNVVSHCKALYINGLCEAPARYVHQVCFKLLGDLGPMLHPNPDRVLMICFGGGMAAGAVVQLPEVQSLTVVDLESSVVAAASLLAEENNRVLENPKTHVVIDDGRNYLMMDRRKWPVIISDSTHPKSSDSWVLYTKEFYELVRERLTDDGIFVEWVPSHDLRTAEFKTIVRTFQSVFPHTSLWVVPGLDEEGGFAYYGLLVSTPAPLRIDFSSLRKRLSAEPVRADLEPFGLQSPAGFLDAFLSSEDGVRTWVGEGPINTDDLPYTYYNTSSCSKGPLMNQFNFLEPMEDPWPFLTGVGRGDSETQLHAELELRVKAKRSIISGPPDKTLLPGDIRYQHMCLLYEQAPAYLKKMTRWYWDDPKILPFFAMVMGHYPGTEKYLALVYEHVLELDPKNAGALSFLAGHYARNGEMDTAEKYYRRAMQFAPDSAQLRMNFALLLNITGRQGEAFRQWELAAATSEDTRAADQWGICLVMERRLLEAEQWFRRAVDLDPTNISARLHLAALLRTKGGIFEAGTHLEYVLKLDPENKLALGMLGRTEPPASKASLQP
jgi:spermidine synthase